jgi:GNAT superfamily N-acetyltransferase
MAATPTTSDIAESDLPAVAQFLAGRARAGEAIDPGALPLEERLRWALLDNPARQQDVPLGWCLRDNDRIVGTLLAVPFRLALGDFSCVALTASQFYVDPKYHAAGIGPFMRYLRLGGRFLLLNTTANTTSGAIFAKCRGKPIEGTDHTMLGVARPGPLIEEWLYRKTRRRWITRILALPALLAPGRLKASATNSDTFIPIRSAEQAAEVSLTPPRDALAVVRDPAYIRWRYFSGDRGKDVYRFRAEGEPDRLVVANLVRLGHRGQIRVLNILDVWPPATPASAPLLAGQLVHRYRGHFDAVWFRGQSPSAEAALQKSGFLRHAFPGPLGWRIDPQTPLPSASFYLMPGESE